MKRAKEQKRTAGFDIPLLKDGLYIICPKCGKVALNALLTDEGCYSRFLEGKSGQFGCQFDGLKFKERFNKLKTIRKEDFPLTSSQNRDFFDLKNYRIVVSIEDFEKHIRIRYFYVFEKLFFEARDIGLSIMDVVKGLPDDAEYEWIEIVGTNLLKIYFSSGYFDIVRDFELIPEDKNVGI
jgi:hypothetical protein